MSKTPSKMMAALLEAEWRPRPGYRTSEVEEKTHRTYFGGRIWYRPRVKVVSDYPVPSVGPKDALIKVKACGICGSDLHMIETDKEGYMLSWAYKASCSDRTRVFRTGGGSRKRSQVVEAR
jgi:hypothetical protein